MPDIILRDESYKVVGIFMEVHGELGCGFKEVIIRMRWNWNLPTIRFLF